MHYGKVVLDLFSGRCGWSKAFWQLGFEVITLDIDPQFEPDIVADILDLTPGDLPDADIILASPPCECFSVASIGHHWESPGVPKTVEAVTAMSILEHTLELIRAKDPDYWWLENPVGMMRKMDLLQGVQRTTVTYCQYGETRQKPTDLWGVWPDEWVPREPCKRGMPCHVAAPRGSRTGTQGIKGSAARAVIPYQLSMEVAAACIRAYREEAA